MLRVGGLTKTTSKTFCREGGFLMCTLPLTLATRRGANQDDQQDVMSGGWLLNVYFAPYSRVKILHVNGHAENDEAQEPANQSLLSSCSFSRTLDVKRSTQSVINKAAHLCCSRLISLAYCVDSASIISIYQQHRRFTSPAEIYDIAGQHSRFCHGRRDQHAINPCPPLPRSMPPALSSDIVPYIV